MYGMTTTAAVATTKSGRPASTYCASSVSAVVARHIDAPVRKPVRKVFIGLQYGFGRLDENVELCQRFMNTDHSKSVADVHEVRVVEICNLKNALKQMDVPIGLFIGKQGANLVRIARNAGLSKELFIWHITPTADHVRESTWVLLRPNVDVGVFRKRMWGKLKEAIIASLEERHSLHQHFRAEEQKQTQTQKQPPVQMQTTLNEAVNAVKGKGKGKGKAAVNSIALPKLDDASHFPSLSGKGSVSATPAPVHVHVHVPVPVPVPAAPRSRAAPMHMLPALSDPSKQRTHVIAYMRYIECVLSMGSLCASEYAQYQDAYRDLISSSSAHIDA